LRAIPRWKSLHRKSGDNIVAERSNLEYTLWIRAAEKRVVHGARARETECGRTKQRKTVRKNQMFTWSVCGKTTGHGEVQRGTGNDREVGWGGRRSTYHRRKVFAHVPPEIERSSSRAGTPTFLYMRE